MPWPKGTPHTEQMIAERVKTFSCNGKRRKPKNSDRSEAQKVWVSQFQRITP